MKVLHIVRLFVLSSFAVVVLEAQDPSKPIYQYPDEQTVSSPLSLLKSEFSKVKTALNQIKDSQDPSVVRAGVSTLEGLLKEITYITTATLFGGGSVVLLGTAGALLVLPVTILASYISLKFIFHYVILPYKSTISVPHIKESLLSLEQSLDNLDNEIKKIEKAVQPEHTIS